MVVGKLVARAYNIGAKLPFVNYYVLGSESDTRTAGRRNSAELSTDGDP